MTLTDFSSSEVCTSENPAILQVFNRYLEYGGEEAWFNTLTSELGLPACVFQSSDWRGAGAPPAWRQALLMMNNSKSRAQLRDRHAETKSQAWLFHNIFPVGSAGLYAEALRLHVPVIQYIHSFRPFSITGYLSGNEADQLRQWPRTYWREIRQGAWQNSRARTAWYASVLSLTRALGWFRAIKAWIAPSDFMRQKFISAGIQGKDIFTLRHFWKPMSDPPPAQDEGYYLFMGRLVEMKGVNVLLEAWDIILRERGAKGPKLMIAGDGELAPAVVAGAAANSLITYCGRVDGDEKKQLLRGCSAMVAPSLCLESLGLVTYEAYDYAKPMLAARSGGLAETVAHGVTGLIHEPGDAIGLARQVLELDLKPDRRRKMGGEGRAWLLQNTGFSAWKAGFDRVVQHAIAAP